MNLCPDSHHSHPALVGFLHDQVRVCGRQARHRLLQDTRHVLALVHRVVKKQQLELLSLVRLFVTCGLNGETSNEGSGERLSPPRPKHPSDPSARAVCPASLSAPPPACAPPPSARTLCTRSQQRAQPWLARDEQSEPRRPKKKERAGRGGDAFGQRSFAEALNADFFFRFVESPHHPQQETAHTRRNSPTRAHQTS